MAETDIFKFLLVHGYRQEVFGETPIWFGQTSARMLLSNFPFNPNMRDLPIRCRSRLYPERYWLRHSMDLLCIGISELVSFSGAGSAGLGLYADCSANLDVPFEDLIPNVICYAHRPRINRLAYNDNYGYWTNRYLIWSQTKLSPM